MYLLLALPDVLFLLTTPTHRGHDKATPDQLIIPVMPALMLYNTCETANCYLNLFAVNLHFWTYCTYKLLPGEVPFLHYLRRY